MKNLQRDYVRLKENGLAHPVEVTASFWQELAAGKFGSMASERLVMMGEENKDWSTYEMHPKGEEIVCLVSGKVDMLLQTSPSEQIVALRHPGDFVLIERGIWHTANVLQPAKMIFITPGEGTQHRPRNK